MKKRNYFIAMALGFTIIIGGCGSTASRQTPPVTTNQESSQTDTAQNTIPTETVIQSTQPADTATQNLQPADTSTQISDSFVQNAQSSSHDNGNTSTASSIGEVQALEIALNHAGVKSSDLAFSYAHGDFDDGRSVYDVEFVVGNTEYDYEIDATTGNILSFDSDMERQFVPSNTPSDPTNTGSTNASSIGESKALEIALNHAGVKSSDLAFSYAHGDFDDGRSVYDVEFVVGNTEYDYEIDATTGNILDFDYDMESHFTPSSPQSSTPSTTTNTAAVSIETAKQTALAKVPGATDSHIRIQTDYDDGRTIYEGKIIYNEMEYDFEIDAATGQITDWDAESIYD